MTTALYAAVSMLVLLLGLNNIINYGETKNQGNNLIIILSISLCLCINVYGILFAGKRFLEALYFSGTAVFIYLVSVFISTRGGTLNYQIWFFGMVSLCAYSSVVIIHANDKKLFLLSGVLRFCISEKTRDYLLPATLGGIVNGVALMIIYQGFTANDSRLDLAYFGYILVLKSCIQFFSTVFNKMVFLNLVYNHDRGEFNINWKFVLRNLFKNLSSILLSALLLLLLYIILYDYYFNKFEAMEKIVYLFLLIWVGVESLYFVLYQSIQVNGRIWGSLIYISVPSLLYATLYSRFFEVSGIEGYVLSFIGLSTLSVVCLIILLWRTTTEVKR